MISDQHIRALTFLAKDCRPNGAKRWDEAGIAAAIERIRGWSLPEVVAEVITAASDRSADTPGVIGKQGRSWESVRAVRVDSAPVGTRCTVCGQVEEFYMHSLGRRHGAHDYSRPRPPDFDAIQARIAALRAELAPTSGPTQRRSLEDLAEANPDLHERVEALRATNPGLTAPPMKEPTEGETV